MKRFWMKVGVTLGTALVTGAIVSACAHNDTSVFIRQVMAPGTPTNGMCTFTADPTQAALSFGLADVAYAGLADYTPDVLVGNQITSAADPDQEQTESSRIIITGAITRITDLAGDTSIETLFATMCNGGKGDQAACATGRELQAGTLATPVNPFSTVETTTIEPSTGGTASYSILGVTFIDGATVQAMRAYFVNLLLENKTLGLDTPALTASIQLVSYTKAEGVTLGGEAVESNEFEFPVTFTYGQLVANGFEADPTSMFGICLAAPKAVTETCVSGQDGDATTASVVEVPTCGVSTAIAATPDAGTGDGG
jgi:hypothetical protein